MPALCSLEIIGKDESARFNNKFKINKSSKSVTAKMKNIFQWSFFSEQTRMCSLKYSHVKKLD